MITVADCPDCGRVELYRMRCPRCGGASWQIAGGMPSRLARRLPWLRRLKAAKPVADLQRRIEGFAQFRKGS